eukprot:TRINITY_DN1223_c0_g3_i1.p1 TRINITY_DN1223_c0_g3~~TRINITY_DN1223_c0_g3_i1.p1  ORF type:complete len:1108 (+),score=353.08 TRINITY_DN1223_c0_g3_i1:2794-6117(+)
MTLSHALVAGAGIVGDDGGLHIVEVGCHQAEALHPGEIEDLVQGQYRGAGRDAGGLGDAGAQPFIGLEAEPAGGSPVPADAADLGMRQQLGSAQDLAVIELRQRLVGQGDLGDAKTPEVGTGLGEVSQHGRGHRFQRGVGGRREHAEQGALGHGVSFQAASRAASAWASAASSRIRPSMWRLAWLNSWVVVSRGRGRSMSISSRMRPGRWVITATLVARISASSTLWVTKTMVPSQRCHRATSSSCISILVWASRAAKGSSIRITEGFCSKARAIPTRCAMPPESSLGQWFSKPLSLTVSMKGWAAARRSAALLPCSLREKATLSHTGNQGIRLACWNTMPRSAPGPVMVRPATLTSPLVGNSKPAIMFSSVDLPQPEGPSRQRNSFFSSFRLTWSMASMSVPRLRSLKTLTMSFNSMNAMMCFPWSVRAARTGAGSALALHGGDMLPAQHGVHDLLQDPVGQEAQQADADHGGDHQVVAQEVIRIPQRIAETALDRHHLGRDGEHPGAADADAQAREDAGHGRRQDHEAQQLALARPGHGRRAQEVAVGRLHAMHGVHQDGEESPQEHQEDGRLVGDAEPDDGQRDPRHRRHRSQHLHGGLDGTLDPAPPADGHAQGDARDRGDQVTGGDAQATGHGVIDPFAAAVLGRLVDAEDPVHPSREDPRRRRQQRGRDHPRTGERLPGQDQQQRHGKAPLRFRQGMLPSTHDDSFLVCLRMRGSITEFGLGLAGDTHQEAVVHVLLGQGRDIAGDVPEVLHHHGDGLGLGAVHAIVGIGVAERLGGDLGIQAGALDDAVDPALLVLLQAIDQPDHGRDGLLDLGRMLLDHIRARHDQVGQAPRRLVIRIGEMLAHAGHADLRGKGFDRADQFHLAARQRRCVIGGIGDIDELHVLGRIDAMAGQFAAHVQVLCVTARGGDAEGLALGLVLGDQLLQPGPVIGGQLAVLAHQHLGTAIDLARHRHQVEALVQATDIGQVSHLGDIDALGYQRRQRIAAGGEIDALDVHVLRQCRHHRHRHAVRALGIGQLDLRLGLRRSRASSQAATGQQHGQRGGLEEQAGRGLADLLLHRLLHRFLPGVNGGPLNCDNPKIYCHHLCKCCASTGIPCPG